MDQDPPLYSTDQDAPMNEQSSDQSTDVINSDDGSSKKTKTNMAFSLLSQLTGDKSVLPDAGLKPYLPSDIVGGSVPYIPGMEEESIWNAATQACGTERVHYVFTIDNNRCWYLAVPSSSLASNPDSWCPLAAALPGNSEYWDRETVYIYEQEGVASALRWDPDTGRMQVFLGPARTILPRIQSLDANFVTINPEMAEQARWRNKSLRADHASKVAGLILTVSGVAVAIIASLFIMVMHLQLMTLKPDLETAKTKTEEAAQQLMLQATQSFENETSNHMIRIQELLDELQPIQGTLLRYEVIAGGRVEWDALVPRSYSSGDNKILGNTQTIGGLQDDGRVKIRGRK